VVFIARRFVELANEFKLPLYMLDGDVEKAYDNTLH